MDEPVVAYVMKVLVDIRIEEAQFLKMVEKEVEKLIVELHRIACMLDIDARQKSNALIELWVEHSRKYAYEMQDLVESFMLRAERIQKKRTGSIHKFMLCSCHSYKLLCSYIKFSIGFESLMLKIDDMWKSREIYGMANVCSSGGERKYVEKDVPYMRKVVWHELDHVVGMEDEKKAIIGMLLREKVKRRSVISIVGMGGLGKSTLAGKVFNDPQITNHFDLAIWVNVSMDNNNDQLLKNLVMQVSEEKREEVGNMTQTELELSLYRSLQGVKYLIVMDDLWESDIWHTFKQHIPDEGNGSRVLITTRKHYVAIAADPSNSPYCLRFLSEEESWELFLKKSIPKIDERKHCLNELELGKQMVEKCGGLPLALVVLGTKLAGRQRSLSEWSIVEKTLIWQLMEGSNVCKKILLLSYIDLPKHLKWCFLYLSVFPKDMRINVEKLMRLWMAEGFVPKREDLSLEKSAELCLEQLIQRCLVQVVESSQGTVEECYLHKVLYDLASTEAKALGFINRYTKSLHVTISCTSPEEIISWCPPTMLGFKFRPKAMGLCTIGLKLVKVIDLEEAPISVVPYQVGDLGNLRYLGLRKTFIKLLPKSLGRLSRLQTLDIRETFVKQLNVMRRIKTLRHLLIPRGMKLNMMDRGNLVNLRVIEKAQAGNWILNVLPNLKNLQTLRLTSIENIHHLGLYNALHRLSCLNTLELEGKSIVTVSSISKLGDLETLILSGRIQRCPQNLGYQWSPMLSVLRLSNTWLDEDPLPSLGKLSHLRFLELRINAYCGKEITCPCDAFPHLEVLVFYYLENLERWTLNDGAMPCLKKILLSSSKKLTMLPRGMKSLCSLEELSIVNMADVLSTRLDKENGEDWENIQHVRSINIDHVQIHVHQNT